MQAATKLLGTVLAIGISGGAVVPANAINLANVDAGTGNKSGNYSVNQTSEEQRYIRPPITCPSDMAGLLPLLLRDLPSYANRVSTRAQVLERSFNPRGVVIAAAQSQADEQEMDRFAEVEDGGDRGTDIQDRPVERNRLENRLGNGTEMPSPLEMAEHQLIPVFFTTLERQYLEDGAVRLQHYHWAFLSRHQHQWHLALMFSRLGDYPANQPVSPPRESRQGTIGQALQLWLRDCNAGSVEGV